MHLHRRSNERRMGSESIDIVRHNYDRKNDPELVGKNVNLALARG